MRIFINYPTPDMKIALKPGISRGHFVIKFNLSKYSQPIK